MVVKNSPANVGDMRDTGSIPGQGRSLEEEMATTPVFLPGKFHGQRSLAGYSPQGHKREGHNLAAKQQPPSLPLIIITMPILQMRKLKHEK